jgi:hypothetical protein
MYLTNELVILAKTPSFFLSKNQAFSGDSDIKEEEYFSLGCEIIKKKISKTGLFANENAVAFVPKKSL